VDGFLIIKTSPGMIAQKVRFLLYQSWLVELRADSMFHVSSAAMGEFWRARKEWYATWSEDVEKRSMVV